MPKFRPGDLLRGSLPYHPMIVAQYQTSLKFSGRFHTENEGRYTCTHPVDVADASGAHSFCYAEVSGRMYVSSWGGEVCLQRPRIETHVGSLVSSEDPKARAGVLRPSRGEYEIWLPQLDDDDNLDLGLTFDEDYSVGLFVDSVGRRGRVHEWNMRNHVAQVSPGDQILKVNDVFGSPRRLREELRSDGGLHIKFRRKDFTLEGELRLGVTPGWSIWAVQDVVLAKRDLDIRCGGKLSHSLLQEHLVNWVSLSCLGLLAVPFSSCETGYQHWVLALAIPFLIRGMLVEASMFHQYFRHNPKIMNELVGLAHPLLLSIASRIEQLDIMTDTLFVARALQCSSAITEEWQATWAEVPIFGPMLAASAGIMGYGGFTLILYLTTVLLPQGILGYRSGRQLTELQTSFEKDPCGTDGTQDILPLQDLSSSSCCCLIEKSLETHAQVQYNDGELVVNLDVRLPVRIFIKCCMENFLQLWNQVTFLGLTYSEDTMADVQVGCSIVLSLILLLIKVHKLAPEEGSYWEVMVQFAALPIHLVQLLLHIGLTTAGWALYITPLVEYSEQEAYKAQVKEDEGLRQKYLLKSGGNLNSIELSAIRKHGKRPLVMACRRHFHKLGFSSHRFTPLPKAAVVAAALVWCILAILMRLAGAFLCTSHAWNLSTLRCLPPSAHLAVA